jgi:AcrR family transcriptional regulator
MSSSMPHETRLSDVQPTRRPRRHDVRRRLLDAALAEFTRHGYDRTSLDQVAAAAGFSKGAIYSNFTGKEDLFLTLMDQQVRHRLERIIETVAGADQNAGQAAIADDVGHTLTSLIAGDVAWQVLFLEYVTRAARDPASQTELTERRRQIRALVAAAAHDLLGPDHPIWRRFTPDIIAVTVLALTNGLAIERIADPQGVPDDLLGQLLRALL